MLEFCCYLLLCTMCVLLFVFAVYMIMSMTASLVSEIKGYLRKNETEERSKKR